MPSNPTLGVSSRRPGGRPGSGVRLTMRTGTTLGSLRLDYPPRSRPPGSQALQVATLVVGLLRPWSEPIGTPCPSPWVYPVIQLSLLLRPR